MAHFESPEEILNQKATFEELSGSLTGVEQALYKEIVPVNKEKAISPDSFADLYDPRLIEANKRYVTERNQLINARHVEQNKEVWKQRGELFEAIINTQIAESDWMGPNADVIVPSEYDDLVHGVDSIIEFEDEGKNSHLALAVDVTESKRSVDEKIDRIKENISHGRLAQVRYFKSNNYRGELNEVPHVIIGADRKNINEVATLLLRFKRLRDSVVEHRDKLDEVQTPEVLKKDLMKTREAIANHPMQMVILKEIKAQIETYRAYAEKIGKTKVVEAYDRVLPIINEVMADKEDVTMNEAAEEDPVYNMILTELEEFDKVN